MRDFETRSERNFDSIYQFLNSEQNELELILYSREVVSLQRRIPRIVIIKGKPTHGIRLCTGALFAGKPATK